MTTAKRAAKESLERENIPLSRFPALLVGPRNWGRMKAATSVPSRTAIFALPKVLATRPFTEKEAEELLRKKFIGPLTGFLSRFKKPFDAAVELQEDKKAGFKASFIFEKTAEEEEEGRSNSGREQTLPLSSLRSGKAWPTETITFTKPHTPTSATSVPSATDAKAASKKRCANMSSPPIRRRNSLKKAAPN